MKTHLYFIGLLFLARCSAPPDDFKEYVSQIQTVPLPITFRTIEFSNNKTQNSVNESLFNKYKYVDTANVYGTIFKNDKIVAIIYTVNGDVLVPVLVTYDKRGNRIDSLNLFENASGFNLETETYVTSTFYPDKSIQEIDSISTWTLNNKGNDRIPESEIIKVDTLKYVITESGKIIKSKHS